MDLTSALTSAHGLTNRDIALLKKGNFQTIADLLLAPTQDIARRCRSSPVDIKRIVDAVLDKTPVPKLCRLDQYPTQADTFTTGSEIMDNMLGGGLRTGMVWEVVGESAAGKTQFALQASLFVQLPLELGGLNGSACYITTSSTLPTERLHQICRSHGRLVNSSSGLEHVHTLSAPTVSVLQHVLTNVLPSFVEDQRSKAGGRAIKLLVIDALGELFHVNDRTTTSTLVARSKDISALSVTLHELASTHQMAILVLNEVIDIFDRSGNQHQAEYQGLLYEYQSRWFNSAEFFGERKKEASLGLVWANQVNTRIMLSRTGRRKYIDLEDLAKRSRSNDGTEISRSSTAQEDQQPTLIRRFSVLFSNVCLPFTLDYIVTESGITVLPDQESQPVHSGNEILITRGPVLESTSKEVGTQSDTSEKHPQPASSTSIALSTSVEGNFTRAIAGEEEDDHLWSHTDSYDDLDWDALEQSLSQVPVTDNNNPIARVVD